MSAVSSTIALRVQEFAVKASCQSQAVFSLCLDADLLQGLRDDLASDDVLLVLNSIELFQALTDSEHTFIEVVRVVLL